MVFTLPQLVDTRLEWAQRNLVDFLCGNQFVIGDEQSLWLKESF